MIVALIADQLLAKSDPAARASVSQLLQTDTSNLTSSTSIGAEATWADRYRDTAGGKFSANWHFIDLDVSHPDLSGDCFGRPRLQPGQLASKGPAEDCIVTKIEEFAAEIRDPATPAAERLLALQFLLHLVGDIHQPLHAADHRIPGSPKGRDFGGNCVGVLHGKAKTPIRLHAYWDDNLVTSAVGGNETKAAKALVESITKAEQKQWESGTPGSWAMESHQLAVQIAYNEILNTTPVRKIQFKDRRGEPDARCGVSDVFRLDAAYDQKARAAVREQLKKAGVRLAWLLRSNLAKN